MKKIILLFVIFIVISACNRPMKLLEKGRSKTALKASMNRLKSGKIKDDHLYVFEKSFLMQTEKDARLVQSLKQQSNPAVWLDIHKTAKSMVKRQAKVNAVLNRLNSKGHYPQMDFYPANSLLEEATNNVALYYYAKAQEFIPRAKNDDRLAARQAYKWLKKSQKYRPDFKDTQELASEMYAIGTTHVLLNPLNGFSSKEDRLFAALLGRQSFPERKSWEVYHIVPPYQEAIDYRVDMTWERIYVSWDNIDLSSCTNTVAVQDGIEEFEVWSEADSTYIIKSRPVYIDVSVRVNNYYQSKNAQLKLYSNIYNVATQERENSFAINHQENWANEYSQVSGDERALSPSCNDIGGFEAFFPSDWSLLKNATYDIHRKFDCIINREIN